MSRLYWSRQRLVAAIVLAGVSFIFILALIAFLLVNRGRTTVTVNPAVATVTAIARQVSPGFTATAAAPPTVTSLVAGATAPPPTPLVATAAPAAPTPQPTQQAPTPVPVTVIVVTATPVILPPPPPAPPTLAPAPPAASLVPTVALLVPPTTLSPAPAAPTAVPIPTVALATPQNPQQATAGAQAAAVQIYGAAAGPQCQPNNPQRQPCLTAKSNPDQAQRGIAVFSLTGASSSTNVVLGRDPSGAWQSWFAFQNASPYPLLQLPGDLRVCAAGNLLELLAAPDPQSAGVGTINDQTMMPADYFVLTQPQTMNGSTPVPGYGWYHVTAPRAGWAYSKYVTAGALGNCQLRDQMEGP